MARGFEDLEAASIIDICGWTYYRRYLQKVDVSVTGFHKEVTGRFGLKIKPDVLIDDRIISCAGPAQSLHVVMIMLEMLLGSEEIKKIKEFTIFEK